MAALGSEAPDPKAFKSWEDAFKYPVPIVRRFQQQLKGDIASNRERLRSLVGGSYRELLGTADAIIQMDSQMKEVEVHLGETSRRCNTDRMSRSSRNASKLMNRADSSDKEVYSTISQLAVLHVCPDVLIRVLRKRGSVLLAAKILVIARRLYRTLSESPHVSEYAERVWSRLSKLRQKLRDMIHRQLTSPKTSEAGLIDALCAYALATSSASASDLLRQFHRLRRDALAATPRKGTSHHQAALSNLELWIRTLQDTRSIFQKPLAIALAKLKSGPIFKDPEVQEVDEFNLEAHEAWLGDDIRNFTPYLRHDDLNVSEAAKQLSSWAPDALKAMLANMQQSLASIESITDVVDLRKECLELLFSHYHIAGVRKEVVLTSFREAFEKRLHELVDKICQELQAVATTMKEAMEDSSSTENSEQVRSLWSDNLVQTDTVRDIENFTKTIHDTLRGLTPTVTTVADRYKLWIEDVNAVEEVISAMKNTKWEDHLDELDSDSDSDGERTTGTTAKQIQKLLKEADPKSLQDSLSKNLSSSFKKLAIAFAKLVPESGTPHAQVQGALLLRVVREIEVHLPANVPAAAMSLPNITQLYSTLALPPVTAAVTEHKQAIVSSLARKMPPGRQLWDEEDPLPTLPSPWVFRLLQSLETTLAELGADLWAPDAVHALQDALADQLRPLLQERLEPAPVQEPIKEEKEEEEKEQDEQDEQDEPSTNPPELTADSAKQALFDIDFLACLSPTSSAGGSGGAGGGGKDGGGERAKVHLRAPALKQADVDDEQVASIAAAAKEYRKRTALLFPLTNC